MPVLFAFSILALVALLWATVSIVGVMRRSRRRARRRAADADGASPSTNSAVTFPLHPLVYEEPFAAEPSPPFQSRPPAERLSEPSPLSAVEPQLIPPPPPPPRMVHREARQPVTVIAREAADSSGFEPLHTVSPPPPPPPPSALEPPPRLRSFPTRLGKHAVAAINADETSPRWNPFSDNFGDLTDPSPSRRPRDVRPAYRDDRR